MVTELVKPIVILAKKNLVHNALKNTKIHEIQQMQADCNFQCEELKKEILDLIHMKSD
jgi:hypothetical protein